MQPSDDTSTDPTVGDPVQVIDGTLVVRGEVDLRTVDSLRAALSDLALAPSPAGVRVDLGDVTFIDSTAVGVLISADRELATSGRRLYVTRFSETAERVFRVLGLHDHFRSDG